MTPGAAAVQAGWAALLVDALAAAGVRDLVISPGSRSTPFALAALRQPGLRCHAVVDERSAGFFALGQAKASGRPSALLCTSGSAGAHYLPAIIEAAHAHVPLVVITADRPPELIGCAAAQTIDQLKLFGGHVRAFFDLGAPDGRDEALRGLRRKAAQAVASALGPGPGPVHLNAAARKPLEPAAPGSDGDGDGGRWAARLATLRAEPLPRVTTAAPALTAEALADLTAACAGARRGLIVCGPAPLEQAGARRAVAALAAATGFPLLCEPASQLRFTAATAEAARIDAYDALLRAPGFRAAAAPDLILALGAPPTSSAWHQFVAEAPRCAHHVIAPHGWNDPAARATALHAAAVGPAAAALTAAIGRAGPAAPTAWTRRWQAADARAWQLVDRQLAADALGEPEVARTLVEALPAGALLALGNSLPIRMVNTFCPGSAAEVAVLSQRGANGIDGLISGAAGAASTADRPTALLLGDVSFLHDLSGLAVARRTRTPLAIVVVDNRGGRLFEQLPIASRPDLADAAELERFWLTPPDLDLAHAAALFGLPYRPVASRAALRAALTEALAAPRATLIVATVAPTSALGASRRLWSAVAEATP